MLFDSGTTRAGWDSIVGQEKVKTILRNALQNNRLAHAYLFSGPGGAGMDAAAIVLARAVLCDAAAAKPCGSCGPCGLTAQLRHPNLHLHVPLPVGKGEKADDDPLSRLTQAELDQVRREIGIKAGNPYHQIAVPRANQIKVNSIRELRRRASMGSFDGGWTVFLVLDAGTMTTEAANALLKTLEEPGPGTLIVLTTSEPDSLLPTVVSRMSAHPLRPAGENEIVQALGTMPGVRAPRAAMVAKPRRAVSPPRSAWSTPTLMRSAARRWNCSGASTRRRPMRLNRSGERPRGREEIAAALILLQTWLRDDAHRGGTVRRGMSMTSRRSAGSSASIRRSITPRSARRSTGPFLICVKCLYSPILHALRSTSGGSARPRPARSADAQFPWTIP